MESATPQTWDRRQPGRRRSRRPPRPPQSVTRRPPPTAVSPKRFNRHFTPKHRCQDRLHRCDRTNGDGCRYQSGRHRSRVLRDPRTPPPRSNLQAGRPSRPEPPTQNGKPVRSSGRAADRDPREGAHQGRRERWTTTRPWQCPRRSERRIPQLTKHKDATKLEARQ